MKPTPTSTTPSVRLMDGQPFVRVVDLAHLWDTSTSAILATDKPHQIPEEHIRCIDGRLWCSFQGLRYRLTATSTASRLTRHIREFLDSQEEKKPTAAKPKPEPQATDLGTAALIADARRTASQALAKTQELSGKLDRLTAAIHVVKQTADTALDTATQAADLTQENADIITVTSDRISLRLDQLSEHVDHVEKDAIAYRGDALQRVRQAEREQRGNAARIRTLEEHARAVDWTLAAVATLAVVGRVIRLLRRR